MSGKPEFIEDFQSTHIDPLAPTCQEFDWESVFAGDAEPAESSERDYKALSQAMRAVFRWILSVGYDKPGAEHIIARRTMTLAWMVDPGHIDESPSLTETVKRLRCEKLAMNLRAVAARREWNRKDAA